MAAIWLPIVVLLLLKTSLGGRRISTREELSRVEAVSSRVQTSSEAKPKGSLIQRRSNAEDTRTPLYMLLLLMTPTAVSDGWDNGPGLLAGARAALSEVNEQPDLLHGYRLDFIESQHEPCGSSSTSTGIRNLVDSAINPEALYTPVVAIGGLMCSGPTAEISSIASRQGIDILNLSGANSPLFVQNKDSYPYLWRFLVSAGVFSDLLLKMMDTYQWEKVAVVYSGYSVYYSGIAETFRTAIRGDAVKTIVIENVIISDEELYFSQAISDIRDSRVRVIFTFTNSDQTAKLLCMAQEAGLVHPNYQWILTDDNLDFLKDSIKCLRDDGKCEEQFSKGVNQALMTYFRLYQDQSDTLVSGNTYADYINRYYEELSIIETETNTTDTADTEYGGIMYDQVWALARALHLAIPTLQKNNISIEEYSYSQPHITNILADKLAMVDFIGASSHVSFNDNREVLTTVEIHQVRNDTEVDVGDFTAGKLTLNIGGTLPDDEWNPDVSILPIYATIVLLCGITFVILFVTVVLFVFVAFRNKPRVKATSPALSGLVFVGCYSLCFAALCNLATIGFYIDSTAYIGFCNLYYILIINGMTLIFSTVLVRLLRIFKIFANKKLAYLNQWMWTNWFLAIVICILCFFTNVLLVVWLSVNPLEYDTIIEYHLENIDGGDVLIAEKFSLCTGSNLAFWVAGFLAFYVIMISVIIFLSIRTRKVRYKNFKDTKKVNIFIALLVLVGTLSVAIGTILEGNHVYFAALDITTIVGLSLITPLLCQVFLFLPKIISPKAMTVLPPTASVASSSRLF